MADQQKLLTRYLIFETDEAAVTFTRVGEQLANGAEEALRKHYSDPPTDGEGYFVAVSENSFKLRKVIARVRTSVGDVELPGLEGDAPAKPSSEQQPSDRQEALV